jgi:hypothetical protein|tara:strand:+ start:130 stop:411 length:282 start_codon:yes stop_codon:yes gene_type:complete
MDPISGNNSSNLHRTYGTSEVGSQGDTPIPKVDESSKVSLTNLSELSDRVEQSGDNIRPEIVERAKLLLDDPDWLSDENIDKMVGKIIQNEDF